MRELLRKNLKEEPQLYEQIYSELVEGLLEDQGYTVGRIQAIINNFLAEPDNEQYIKEFSELQKIRKQCKLQAKQLL